MISELTGFSNAISESVSISTSKGRYGVTVYKSVMGSTDTSRARLVGINHVALKADNLDAALEFYEELFEFEIRGRTPSGVFLDMGDQFLAIMKPASADSRDDHRHFGLVVDDPTLVEQRLDAMNVERLSTSGLDFHDPWGNRIQIVGYEEIQFTKADHVREGMGLTELEKSASAIAELAEKGMAPE